MQLKIAEEKDIPELVLLLKEFVISNIKLNQQFDYDTVENLLFDLHENKEAIILTNTNLDGIILGLVMPCLFNNKKQAIELAFYLRPEIRSLQNASGFIKAFEYWAKELMKTDTIILNLLDQRVENLYKRKGYSFVEAAYLKEF